MSTRSALSHRNFRILWLGSVFGSIAHWVQQVTLGWVGYELTGSVAMLGFILGPLMEENLRRAMLLSRGDATVFFQRPISATMLILAIGLLLVLALPFLRKKREEAFVEG